VAMPIELGGMLGEWVEVTNGVQPGEKVIASPPQKLHDGTRISLQAAKS